MFTSWQRPQNHAIETLAVRFGLHVQTVNVTCPLVEHLLPEERRNSLAQNLRISSFRMSRKRDSAIYDNRCPWGMRMLFVAKQLQTVKPLNIREKTCAFVSGTTMSAIVEIDKTQLRIFCPKIV